MLASIGNIYIKKKMLNSLAPMAKEKSRICLLGPLIARVSQVSRSKPFFPLRTWTRREEEGWGGRPRMLIQVSREGTQSLSTGRKTGDPRMGQITFQ